MMDIVEIKKFICKRFSSISDFDDLRRRLGVDDEFEGNWDVKVTLLIKKLEDNIPSTEWPELLKAALIELRPRFCEEINKMFGIPKAAKNNDDITADDEIIKEIRQRITKLLNHEIMEEIYGIMISILNKKNKESMNITRNDICNALIGDNVRFSIALLIETFKVYIDEQTTAKKNPDVWKHLHRILYYLIIIAVKRIWVKENKDFFIDRYKAFRIDFPVLTLMGAEAVRARILGNFAGLCEKKINERNIIIYGTSSHIFDKSFIESGILPEDFLKEIKRSLFTTLIPDEPISEYSDEKLFARLQCKEDIDEPQFLVIDCEWFKDKTIGKMLEEKLPQLNIITLTPDASIKVFNISEIRLDEYVREFYLLKPKEKKDAP